MNPELETPQPPRSNKTVIILLALIIVSGIGLGIMINMQAANNPEQSKTDQAVTTPEPAPLDDATNRVLTEEEAAKVTITQAQIDENVRKGICWTISEGKVYDATNYLRRAPVVSGATEEEICGKDSTAVLKNNENIPPVESFGPFNPYARPVGVLAQ